MLNSFVIKLRVYRFFDDFVIIYALYTLMFEGNGLSVSQISILLAVWSITSFLLEIPSGVLADKYNRRNILILAQTFRVMGFLIWYLFPNFWGFLIGFVFWGLKSAFTSGTLEAHLYDGLKSIGQERKYSKILGSLQGLSFIAILLSSTLSSVLFFLGYRNLLLLSIVSLVISILALVTSKTTKIVQSTQEAKYFSLLKEGLLNVVNNKKMFLLVLISSVLVGAMAVDEYFALYVNEVHLSISLVGYLFAGYSLLQALASVAAHRFETNKLLLPILGTFSVVLLLIGFSGNFVGVALFMLLAFIASLGQVLSSSAIQATTQSHVRATISSVSGFLAEILSFGVFVIFLLIPSGEIKQGIRIFGFIILIVTTAILITHLRLQTKERKYEKDGKKYNY